MKKLFSWMLALLLISAVSVGTLAEGLEIEYDESAGFAVMAAEALEETDITSEAIESPMPEAEDALHVWEGADAEGEASEAAVSAASDVAIDETNFPDDSFREYVKKKLDSNGNGMLSEEERNAVESIDVERKGITSLKGVEWFPNLLELNCLENQLISLDISKNTLLKELYCHENKLTHLDISNNTSLTYIGCAKNKLESLDLSNNPALSGISCIENNLKTLNVDKNAKLVELWCFGNQITSLDVRKCTALTELYCGDNQLKSLYVSTCKALTVLRCGNNPQLKSLNVSGCIALQDLECINCNITSIDITDCKKLHPAVESDSQINEYGYVTFYNDGGNNDDYSMIYFDAYTTLVIDGNTVYGTPVFAKAAITVKAQTYTGKALKPAVTVKLNGETLKKGTDYTVSYKNNKNVGTATVTIKGKGNYTGTATATFKINPKKVSGLKLQAGKKLLTASWKKVAGVTGYQIQYGLKSNFKGSKLLTVKKDKTVKKVLKSLKSGKVYYVRVRAYKKVGKATYYSAWSKAVKKKVK